MIAEAPLSHFPTPDAHATRTPRPGHGHHTCTTTRLVNTSTVFPPTNRTQRHTTRESATLPPHALQERPRLDPPRPPSIMDADAVDASNLCSVSQPLDVLRLELQNEPAFAESSMPKDDHTLTYVRLIHIPHRHPCDLMNPTAILYSLFHGGSLFSPPRAQALLESPWVQCVPGEADGPRLHPVAPHRGGCRHRGALPAHRPFRCAQCGPPTPFTHPLPLSCPRSVSNLRRPLLSHSSPGGRTSLRAGRWASTRCAHSSRPSGVPFSPHAHARPRHTSLSSPVRPTR